MGTLGPCAAAEVVPWGDWRSGVAIPRRRLGLGRDGFEPPREAAPASAPGGLVRLRGGPAGSTEQGGKRLSQVIFVEALGGSRCPHREPTRRVRDGFCGTYQIGGMPTAFGFGAQSGAHDEPRGYPGGVLLRAT